jgi:EAL domain-containing protein (putative c-di-GMP-specific phosphodiesterase class I)
MKHSDSSVKTMIGLRDIGVKLAIDDFGTGYSSLSYLKRFPLYELKIDRSFVEDVTADPDDIAIVTAIIGMAHSLKLKVVAEGVETDEQREFLCHEGCEWLQGFLFSPPVPASAIPALAASYGSVFATPEQEAEPFMLSGSGR